MPDHVRSLTRWQPLLIRIGLLPLYLATTSVLFAADTAEPALPSSAEWLTGRAFDQQLRKPLHANWSSATLRRLTGSIAANQRICILLDRRVDPDQLVDFRASGESLERTLQELGRQLKLGICKIGPVIYIGPTSTTSRLATVSEVKRHELSQAADVLKQQLASSGWQWKRLTTPNDLLQQQVRSAGLTLDPTVRLPHDLWKEQTLPPLDFAQRMSIILAGFNLTFDLDLATRQLHLIPLPEQVSLTRSYTKRLSAANLAKIKRQFPALIIKQTGNRLEVQGSYEDHDLLSRLLRGETIRRTVPKLSQKRFTLRVMQATVAEIIDSVVQQEKFTVRFEPKIATLLKTRVSIDITDATLSELLEKTLGPLGLTYQLKDQQLTITEKRP